ncbi:MAG: DUF4450 domain-containing protein [Bacteroidales bacterium]|nr:DUF4450 domain-containing protein [Bacteroidales bacterium]
MKQYFKFSIPTFVLLISLVLPAFVTAQQKVEWAPRVVPDHAAGFSFHRPTLGGIFRVGLQKGNDSFWLGERDGVEEKDVNGVLVYTVKEPWGGGTLFLRAARLSTTDGVVMQVEASGLPDSVMLIWSFGGCYDRKVDPKEALRLQPDYCKDNVFSVEGNSFTAYYGTTMDLKLMMGVVPPGEIRLSDARQQTTPLRFFQSGKKTDAPALTGRYLLKKGAKSYFCFYVQNAKSDYNYYRLSELFRKASSGSLQTDKLSKQ